MCPMTSTVVVLCVIAAVGWLWYYGVRVDELEQENLLLKEQLQKADRQLLDLVLHNKIYQGE